jgi:hypothetical protein
VFGQGLVCDIDPVSATGPSEPAGPGPEGPPMTSDMMNLRDLVEKTPDAALRREMLVEPVAHPMRADACIGLRPFLLGRTTGRAAAMGRLAGARFLEQNDARAVRRAMHDTGNHRADGRSSGDGSTGSFPDTPRSRHRPARRGILIRQARTGDQGGDPRKPNASTGHELPGGLPGA